MRIITHIRPCIRPCRPPMYAARRCFESTAEDLIPTKDQEILLTALTHVPEYGWSVEAIMQAAKEKDIQGRLVHAIFPNGELDLVTFWLESTRRALRSSIPRGSISLGQVIESRVRYNVDTDKVIGHPLNLAPRLSQMLGILTRYPHVAARELARVATDIAYVANEQGTHIDWYARRTAIGAIFASTDLFLSQDTSPEYVNTFDFLERRIEDLESVHYAAKESGAFIAFQLRALKNVIASKAL